MLAAFRALLISTLLTAMLAGVVDLIAGSMGSGTVANLAALGAVLLCLGWGAVHEGSGPAPPRASFAWLGLAAALPMLAGYAPYSGLAALLLLLPLRATGARLAGLIGERASAVTGAVCGATLGLLWVQTQGLGLPTYLGLWVVTGLVQRYLLPVPDAEPAPTTPVPPGTALFGAGAVWLLLGIRPWLDILDSSSAIQDGLRMGTGALLFVVGWVTLGGAAAEWRHHRLVALLAATTLGALASGLPADLAWYTSPPGYTATIGSTALRSWTESDAPYLLEENPAYPVAMAVVMLALPLTLLGVMLRALGGNRPRGRSFLAPLLTGAGAALVVSSLFPGFFAAAAMLPAALALIGGAALEGWWTTRRRVPQLILTGLPLLAGALFIRFPDLPPSYFPFPDAYRWQVATSADGEDRLEQRTLTSIVRRLERQAPIEDGGFFFTADGRNLLTPTPAKQESWLRETRFLADLIADPKRATVIGSPWQPTFEVLRREGFDELTAVCDPPELARMEFLGTADENAIRIRRTAALAPGSQDLILIRDPLMWESDHHLLRQDLLQQCKHRLSTAGVLAFSCSPDQFQTRMFPQWVDEFRRMFDVVEVWLFPDGLDGLRLVVTGRTTRSGVPDREILGVELKGLPAGRPFLFRAPLQRSLPALADTDYKVVDAHRSIRRAAAVLDELRNLEEGERLSLLGFYALQLQAQVYSIHDSYLVKSPYSVEIDGLALLELLRISRSQPDSAVLREMWAEVGRGLIEQQDIGTADRYFTILLDELGWREPEVLLTLAHTALEMLEDDLALERLEAALELRPGWRPAEELHRIVVAGESPQRELHAGHDHD